MKESKFYKRSGFTMLEMMIIVVIIGIMAGLAVPSFMSWIPKMKLKNDARQNLNLLRQARSKSVSDNSQYGIYFDIANKQIHFFEDNNNPELTCYEPGSDSLVIPPVNLESNVSFGECLFNGDAVVFYPNGSASTSGSITVQDTTSDNFFTISVLASTGRVKME